MERSRILVWDLPVRVFHWLLVATFAGAFVTAESERLRGVHALLGYALFGLLAFRLVWGVIGSRYARFASFAFGPGAVLAYLRSLVSREPLHHVGHNPAGSYVIYALIGLGLVTAATGHALDGETGGRWLEALHEGAANAMLAVVIVHVAGVIVASLLHRENLVAAMVTGYKAGPPSAAIDGARRVAALALLGAVAVFVAGAYSVRGLPGVAAEAASRHEGDAGHSRHKIDHHDG